MRETIHFSGLNGIRAIAALAVVFAHTTTSLDLFGLDQFFLGSDKEGIPVGSVLAGFGVSIFFTLSGFLITYLLLVEKKVGEISIKNFYIRRVLRIWPLYYLYLFLALLTILIFKIQSSNSSLLFCFFISANIPVFIGTPLITFLGHYWSLGVEEQFYAFWPWVVKRSKSVFRIIVILGVGLIFLKLVLRLVDIKIHGSEASMFYKAIHVTRFQCMLIGAFGAILYYERNIRFMKVFNNILSQFLSWFILFLLAFNKFHIASVIDHELISIVTLALIIGQIEKKNRILNIDSKLFDIIGRISYGIYIIHPIIIYYLQKGLHFSKRDETINYVLIYLLVFSTTIFISYCSYNYFENRFLKLKDKFSTVKSKN